MSNREILSRGKRIDTKEWIEGYFVIDGAGRNLIAVPRDGAPVVTFYPVTPETVGQFTGLTDKNGKKIFEGDIITGYFDHEAVTGHVIYGSDATFFIQRQGLLGIGLNNAQDWTDVIGNIHDNPELLGGDPS